MVKIDKSCLSINLCKAISEFNDILYGELNDKDASLTLFEKVMTALGGSKIEQSTGSTIKYDVPGINAIFCIHILHKGKSKPKFNIQGFKRFSLYTLKKEGIIFKDVLEDILSKCQSKHGRVF